MDRLDELQEDIPQDWLTFSGMPNKIKMIFHPETQKHLIILNII